MACHMRLARVGDASIVSLTGDAIVLRGGGSSPPGSRIEGTLLGDRPLSIRMKVHGCRLAAEGDFVIEARLLDATRELKQRLEAIARSSP